MKKLLAVTLTLASLGFVGFGSAPEANAAPSANAPQIRIRIGQQRRRDRDWRRDRDDRYWDRSNRDWNRDRDWNNNGYGVRSVRQTRLVRYGYSTYRETYLIRYFGNGQTSTTLVSRERIN